MVRLLLDTNALLWLSSGSVRLGLRAGAAIEAAVSAGEAAFSAISVWETAMLVRKGRYVIGQPVERWRADLIEAGLREAPLDGLIAALAGTYADLHEDPADRFIAATSARIEARLVSSDHRLLAWAAHAGKPGIDARI